MLQFGDILDFYLDWPQLYQRGVQRGDPQARVPDYDARFSSFDLAWFAQDEWKVSSRLVVTAGIRYEYFGPPHASGTTNIQLPVLGAGSSLPEKLAAAQWGQVPTGQALYSPDKNNFAGRAGLSYRLGRGNTVLRASYGTFYDHPFNNLWQGLRTNSVQIQSFDLGQFPPLDYLNSLPSILKSAASSFRGDASNVLLYQPGIRDAYAGNYLVGLSSAFGDAWQWEVNHLGSRGRKLITTDQINRPGSVPTSAANALGVFNPLFSTLAYRANQGASNFEGLNFTIRHRSASLFLQGSYTWSHAIDNQSDPLAGEYLDFSFTTTSQPDPSRSLAAFSRQFDSSGDRGNSDFDQRHNLVLLGSWRVPAAGHGPSERLLENWRIAWLATVRSGLPFTVFAPAAAGDSLYNRRADYLGGGTTLNQPIDSGVQLLNPPAFAIPAAAGKATWAGTRCARPPFIH